MSRKTTLKEVIKKIESNPEVRKLPPQIRNVLRESLESMTKVKFPIFTFKENDWTIATTPVIDVAAQGKTEEEAIRYLMAMVDDYMRDPDTHKPTIKTIVNMEIGMKTIPVNLPINESERGHKDTRENTPITS